MSRHSFCRHMLKLALAEVAEHEGRKRKEILKNTSVVATGFGSQQYFVEYNDHKGSRRKGHVNSDCCWNAKAEFYVKYLNDVEGD